MNSFPASPPPLLQMGQCPCLPSVHLFWVWTVGSVCSWQNSGTDLCPPLLTRLQDPGQGSGALSGIYRKIWPGRENKYSPWFHLQYSQASSWNRASLMWSWPCLWRDGYLSTLWLTGTELSEPRGEVLQSCMCPFPLTKLGPFHCFSLTSGLCGTTVLGKMFQVSESLLRAIYMLLTFCEASCCQFKVGSF